MSWDDVQEALKKWATAGSGLPTEKVVWGGADAPRPPAPAILMRISNIAEIGEPELTMEDNPLTFTPFTATVDVPGNRLIALAHGRLTGDGPILLDSSTDDPPAPTAELAKYWLIALDADHLRLADTYEHTGGGQGSSNPITPIVLTDAGTGTLTISPTEETLRAGQELLAVSRAYLRVSLELRCHAPPDAPDGGENLPTSILQRIRTRRKLPSMQEILSDVNVAVIEVERVRAILGIRDAVLFEPRAWLNVYLCVPVEESEYETIIASVEMTNMTTGRVFEIP